jgi:hypothetical protein
MTIDPANSVFATDENQMDTDNSRQNSLLFIRVHRFSSVANMHFSASRAFSSEAGGESVFFRPPNRTRFPFSDAWPRGRLADARKCRSEQSVTVTPPPFALSKTAAVSPPRRIVL